MVATKQRIYIMGLKKLSIHFFLSPLPKITEQRQLGIIVNPFSDENRGNSFHNPNNFVGFKSKTLSYDDGLT
jgi:hypothetical protein